MEIRAIRYVLAVAETLHFGRASEQSLISQPALSRQVQAMEREIGVTLFDRTSRSVELTAAGARFVPLARKALAILDAAAVQARESARGSLGQVRLGFVATAAIDILPRVLAVHRAQRPRVSVSLTECTSGEQIEALQNGLIDVALGRDLPPMPGVQVSVFRTEDYVVVVPVAHPFASVDAVSIDELAGLPLVRLAPGVARRADALLAQVAASAVSGKAEAADVQHAHQYRHCWLS